MGRIEKTVFISYRRTNLPWALCIYQDLTSHGYDVFFDYQSIDSGNFEKVILENIKARAHFLVLLTPSALERCKEPSDWLRREIETAIDEKRNIVPLMLEGFDFGSPVTKEALTDKLSTLNAYNGLSVYSEYFFEAMDKLRSRYLSIEISQISLPTLNSEVKEITKSQKTAADEATPVDKEELTAQILYERGRVFQDEGNYGDALRCFREAIRLSPRFASAYLSVSKLQINDWRIIHTISEDGSDLLREELTLTPIKKPNCVYYKRYSLPQESENTSIRVSAENLPTKIPLTVFEIGHTAKSNHYIILLDPPSTVKTPQRIAITCERKKFWTDLVTKNQQESSFQISQKADSIQVELLAPQSKIWKHFEPESQIGSVKIESENISKAIWSIKDAQPKRYYYQFSWGKGNSNG